jgi:7-carboxy-7-deazaguanine synthase
MSLIDLSISPETPGINLALLVQEAFFKTVQGEGALTGISADFIRLGGCAVGCWFCDTGYAAGSRQPTSRLVSIDDLAKNLSSPLCVITGGEPYQQSNLPELICKVLDSNRICQIETSGTVWLNIDDRAWVTLSPKELYTKKSTDPRFWKRADELKLVISNAEDLNYYSQLLEIIELKKGCQIFLQPEYANRELMIPLIVEQLPAFPIAARLSLQTHKYIGVR